MEGDLKDIEMARTLFRELVTIDTNNKVALQVKIAVLSSRAPRLNLVHAPPPSPFPSLPCPVLRHGLLPLHKAPSH